MEQNLISVKERFWSKVDIQGDDDCWNWLAGTDGRYGLFRYENKKNKSNRMSWFLTHGVFPELHVLHKCDNTICCNPNHLFLGTHQENMDDKVRKGRQYRPFGDKNPLVKLNKEKILKIRRMISEHVKQTEIAKIFNVDAATITDIKNGKTWNWVK